MPFTFAHPAAVLPFRKYCPNIFNLPALMAGSITPDLGYYLHNWIWSISGHSFTGSLRFDIPAGLALVSLFYLFVRPVSRLLPSPHREACSSICPVLKLPGLRSIIIATYSVLIGAWTHVVWDGFTHENGWCVRQLAEYTPTLFSIGGYHVTIWHLLQHGSTFFGLMFLYMAYNRYAHGKRFLKERQLLGPKLRAFVWFLMLTPPGVLAISSNLGYLAKGISFPRLDAFTFNATVSYICTFIPILCSAGVVLSLLEYILLNRKENKVSHPAQPSLPAMPLPFSQARMSPVLSAAKGEVMPMAAEALTKQIQLVD